MKELPNTPHQLPFKLLCEVCSAIMDTGFVKSPSEYIKQYYGKEFSELTQNEAEMIIRNLSDKPGCLYQGDPKDLIPKENGEDIGEDRRSN